MTDVLDIGCKYLSRIERHGTGLYCTIIIFYNIYVCITEIYNEKSGILLSAHSMKE